jgi:tetratricopeptide (TPR) repeat protein
MDIVMRQLILTFILVLIPLIAIAQTAEEYYTRGNAKGELGDYRSAIQNYNKAIQLKPNYANAYNNRGGAKVSLGDYRGAIQDFNKAIELDPNYANAYYNRGVSKIGLGQKDSGCLDLSKAGELLLMDAYYVIKKHCQ